jgi:predicted nicotinamide N-methyase
VKAVRSPEMTSLARESVYDTGDEQHARRAAFRFHRRPNFSCWNSTALLAMSLPVLPSYNFVFPFSNRFKCLANLASIIDPFLPRGHSLSKSIPIGFLANGSHNGSGHFLFDIPECLLACFDHALYKLCPEHKCFALFPRVMPLENVPVATTSLSLPHTPKLDFAEHTPLKLAASLRGAGRCCRIVNDCSSDFCEFLHTNTPAKKGAHPPSLKRRNIMAEQGGRTGWGKGSHRNCNRAGIFRKWCEMTYGRDAMDARGGILDVAGGKGELAFELLTYGRISKVTIVDPRPYHVYGMLRRLTLGHVQRIRSRGEQDGVRHVGDHVFAKLPLPNHLQCWFEYPLPLENDTNTLCEKKVRSVYVDENLKSERDQVLSLQENMGTCSVVVGMHPDQATEAIVDFALSERKPFAIVPCCIFPKMFPQRKLKSGEAVVSYDQFCQYLIEKDPSRVRRTTLDFPGRNICLYSLGEENDSFTFLLHAYVAQASFQRIVKNALLALGGWDLLATQQWILANIVNGEYAQKFPVSCSYRKLFLSSYMKMLGAQKVEDVCDELAEEAVASMIEHDKLPKLSFKTYFMATGVSISVSQTSGSLGGAMETGGKVWPASLVLAEYLSAHKELLVGQRVLEIGCGTGVTGIAMGKIQRSGIKRLVLSDFSAQVLHNMLGNVEKNGLHCVRQREYSKRLTDLPCNFELNGNIFVEALLLDICQVSSDDISRIAAGFDVIVLSDMIYDVNLCLSIMTFLSQLLQRNPTIIIISSTEQRGSSSHASYDQRLVALHMKRRVLFSSDRNREFLQMYPWLPFVGQGLGTFNVERIARAT